MHTSQNITGTTVLNAPFVMQHSSKYRMIFGIDNVVAQWGFKAWGCLPFLYNMAVGIVNLDGELKGAFVFSGYNGSEIEVHYYGPGTITPHVTRTMFRIALLHFKVNRLVVRTRKESMARGVLKLGAVYECTSKRVYGPTDDKIHEAKQFAFFKETLERWVKPEKGKQ